MKQESEKMLNVADLTEEVAEVTTEVDETPQEKQEFTDSSSNSTSENKEDDESVNNDTNEEVQKQTSEENAKFAQIRRKAEEDAQKKIEAETKKAYEKGRLEAYKGKINPYTNKPILDFADVEMYEVMYRLESEGKDPITDLPEELAKKRREEAKAIQEKKEMEIKTQQELEEFRAKHPDINVEELLKDSFFLDYMQGKNKTLTELYDGFNNFKNAFRNSAVEVAKQTIANAQATPGSLNSGAEVNIDYANMSDEEFERILSAVKNREMK